MGVFESERSHMGGSERDGKQVGSARLGARSAVMAVAALAGFALAALAGLALASTGTKTVKTAHNRRLGKTIVVDSKGRTLYHLAPETTRHLLCKNQYCFSLWPPYKVSKNAKLTKAAGIKGKLGKLHRDGFWQVTLGGKPLYRYSGDNNQKGATNGNGFPDPPGTWHVVTASSGNGGGSTTTTHTSTSTSSTYSYPY
jgi:predicted lipoprotein with Yx(FWY)xxD motif